MAQTTMLGLDDSGFASYFEDQRVNHHPEFWRRFGDRPKFSGARVLDLGSGVGAMAVEAGEEGAEVLGIELHEERVAFSNRYLREAFPELLGRVSFRNASLSEVDFRDYFDYVVSKDTFEHVEDMRGMLKFLHDVIRPGGEVWAGFSPMWFSPNGDHGLAGGWLPWLHVLLPDSVVMRRISEREGRPITGLRDIDMNGLTPREFRTYVAEAGLEIKSIRYNAGDKVGLRLMGVARRIPRMERFFTAGIYVVLRRPE